jgi:hypothetical protein
MTMNGRTIYLATLGAVFLLGACGCSRQAVDPGGEKGGQTAGDATTARADGKPAASQRHGNAPDSRTHSPNADPSGGSNVSAQGIPEGYDAFEKQELRIGEWRFYLITEQRDAPSIHEANWPVRAGQPRPGPEGLATFFSDARVAGELESMDPSLLATRVAMFLVEGDGRQSCLFQVVSNPAHDVPAFVAHFDKLHPPQVVREDGKLTIRAWLRRDGYLQQMVVAHEEDGPPVFQFGTPLSR